MEHNFNNRIIKSCLSSNHSNIIESQKEQFEKKIKENSERLNRTEKLIIENKELYFQSREKANWVGGKYNE